MKNSTIKNLVNFEFRVSDYITGFLIILLIPYFDYFKFMSKIPETSIINAEVIEFKSETIGAGRRRSTIIYSILRFEHKNKSYQKKEILSPFTELNDNVSIVLYETESHDIVIKPITLWSTYFSINFYTVFTFIALFIWLGILRFIGFSNNRSNKQFNYKTHILYYNTFKIDKKFRRKNLLLFVISFILMALNIPVLGFSTFLIGIYGLSITRTICVDCHKWWVYEGYGFFEYPIFKMKPINSIEGVKVENIDNNYYLFLTLNNIDYCIFNSSSENKTMEILEKVKIQLYEYLD